MRSVFRGIASDERVKFSCLIENYLEAHNVVYALQAA